MSDELIKKWEAGGRKPLVFNEGTRDEIVICDPRRRMRSIGYVRRVPHGCDKPGQISCELGDAVCCKAMALNIFLLDDNEEEKQVERQAGLLLVGKKNDSPVVVPVTAKHNVTGTIDRVNLRFPSNAADPSAPIKTIRGHFDTDTDTEADNNGGTEIVMGSPLKAQELIQHGRVFEKVRDDFQYQVGQKVGVAVWSDIGANPENLSAGDEGLSQAEISEIFGPPNRLAIYCGSIVLVDDGDDGATIEHDVNTYQNCSGAILFLLDKDQPDSVQPEDYGKAIAVHNEALSDTRCNNVAVRLV